MHDHVRQRAIHVRTVVAFALLLGGCARSERATANDGGPRFDAGAKTNSRTTEVLRGFAREGLDASSKLEVDCEDRGAYLALRRSVVASKNVWRRVVPASAEVTFGPEVALDESGGALGRLDRALQRHDCNDARTATRQVHKSLLLANMDLSRRDVARAPFAQALSDNAYELGQAVFESTSFVPEGDDAALADVKGLLEAINKETQALGIEAPHELRAFDRVAAATTLSEITDRATLARLTGELGAALRRSTASIASIRPPLVPLHATEEVSVLTLPRPSVRVDPIRAELGARLFSDARLSRGGARSCATCHSPEHAYIDGRVTPQSLDATTLIRRNTPTLLYGPLQARLTWDGRVRTADQQALSVIHTSAEMGLTSAELVGVIARDAALADAFRRAFDENVSASDVGMALAEFEAQALLPASSPVDRFAEGDPNALSADAREGLDVFVGKERCARCHIPPLWGGSRPTDFSAPVFSVIGVPANPRGHMADPDPGRGGITGKAADGGAFKVPTVRDIALTSPYFHNGSYPTLDEVIDFYDRGGGQGLGLAVPHQDPDVRPLHLTAEEKRALLVFLRQGVDGSVKPNHEPPAGAGYCRSMKQSPCEFRCP